MTDEILREVTTLGNIERATSESVLVWVYKVETKSAPRSPLNNTKEAKDFDAIWQN